jgi:hypothetical protein
MSKFQISQLNQNYHILLLLYININVSVVERLLAHDLINMAAKRKFKFEMFLDILSVKSMST